MERVVTDTNILVKWFIKEEYTEKELLIRGDHIAVYIRIMAPEYAPLEE